MNAFEITLGVILLILSVLLIFVVTMQESKNRGMNALTGGDSSDSYYRRNRARTLDDMLARLTKGMGIIFFIVVIALYAITIFMN